MYRLDVDARGRVNQGLVHVMLAEKVMQAFVLRHIFSRSFLQRV